MKIGGGIGSQECLDMLSNTCINFRDAILQESLRSLNLF